MKRFRQSWQRCLALAAIVSGDAQPFDGSTLNYQYYFRTADSAAPAGDNRPSVIRRGPQRQADGH